MNTKNSSISFLLVSALAVSASFNAFAAKPEVGNVTVSQNKSTRVVTVEYTLSSEPGIVTLDIQTNGVSIGSENFLKVHGDVNKVVSADGASVKKTITWYPHVEWPNRKITDGSLKAVVNAWATNCPPAYMVYNTIMKTVRYYQSAESVPYGVTNDIYKTDCILMRKIPAAGVVFRMGSSSAEMINGLKNDYAHVELPHLVGFTKDFYMAIYPMTECQFYNMMGWLPANGTISDATAKRPVVKATWETLRGNSNWPADGSAVGSSSFFRRIRDLTKIESFDLPTDAQWEFACRAGVPGHFNDGSPYVGTGDTAAAHDCAWTAENEGNVIHDVGDRNTANRFGLYDMHGNVWEMVQDWYSEGAGFSNTFVSDWEKGGITWDPKGPAAEMNYLGEVSGNQRRIQRGGCALDPEKQARSARRSAATVTSQNAYRSFRPICAAEAPAQ